MTKTDQERLADIRARQLLWDIETDTQSWEVPFLLRVIDDLVFRNQMVTTDFHAALKRIIDERKLSEEKT